MRRHSDRRRMDAAGGATIRNRFGYAGHDQ
jgi:hypothetical protein